MFAFGCLFMELPGYYFSEKFIPPSSKRSSLRYDPNRNYMFPVAKNAVLSSAVELDSLILQYQLSCVSKEDKTVLAPLSPCLPLGNPNVIANLQDLCSGAFPLACNGQEWLRGAREWAKTVEVEKSKRDPNEASHCLSSVNRAIVVLFTEKWDVFTLF